MVTPNPSQSMSEFRNDVEGFARQLRDSGAPQVLVTESGDHIVIQHAKAYEDLLDQLDRLRELAILDERRRAAMEGDVIPWEEARRRLRELVARKQAEQGR